jgi:hypothetical protein
MNNFFPKNTVQWKFEEPTVLRRLSLSLWEMAVLTGFALRLYRAVVVNYGSTNWVWLAAIGVGLLLLCAMTTMHLANYTMNRWVWRAPLFAVVEVAAESVTSLALIYFGREPRGSARAEWSDWPSMAMDTLVTRALTVCAWAVILGSVVWVVRRTILREPVEEGPPAE